MSIRTQLGALRRLDWSLLTAAILLAAIGLAALYSLGMNVDHPDMSRVTHQAAAMGIGLVVLFIVAYLDYRFWWNATWVLYGLGALLLMAVLFLGVTIRGTRGWFVVLGQTFQPVEFARIALVLVFSRFFAFRLDGRRRLQTVLLSAALLGIYVGLLFLQPEFGYAALFLVVWAAYILLARLPRWQILLMAIVLIIVSICTWFFILNTTQKSRIIGFVHPSGDTQGQNYNVIQSIVAVGSGQVFGRGLGLGSQSQLNFLPEQTTDFIFAVIAEELGFIGTILVLGTFALLFTRMYLGIRRAHDTYSALLLTGFLATLFAQMIVNIGMNIGLLPVTGIPLPFMSYGGSALLGNFLVIGIIESVLAHQPARRE
jgi:rod shape determining protein RodA